MEDLLVFGIPTLVGLWVAARILAADPAARPFLCGIPVIIGGLLSFLDLNLHRQPGTRILMYLSAILAVASAVVAFRTSTRAVAGVGVVGLGLMWLGYYGVTLVVAVFASR